MTSHNSFSVTKFLFNYSVDAEDLVQMLQEGIEEAKSQGCTDIRVEIDDYYNSCTLYGIIE